MKAGTVRRWKFIRSLDGVAMLAVLAAAGAPPAGADDDIWQRDTLTGDWSGARTQLSQRGIDITFNAPWWTMQADIQQILHPGGNVPDPLNPTQPIQNAFAVAWRNSIKF